MVLKAVGGMTSPLERFAMIKGSMTSPEEVQPLRPKEKAEDMGKVKE